MKRTSLAFLLWLSTCPAPAAPGALFVDGFINGTPARFLVDTGADEISIPYPEAIRMGLPVFAGPRTESSTAGGNVGIYRLVLDSVTVGDVTVQNVAAHVSEYDSGKIPILLGMSFLGRVRFCIQNGRMTISNP